MIRYEKLFNLLDARGIKKYHLRQQGIHAVTMDKLVKGKNVDLTTINRLCYLLDCQPGDLLEYVYDPSDNEDN